MRCTTHHICKCQQLKLEIAVDALKTIRHNMRLTRWERSVLDKAIDMIENPDKYEWGYLSDKEE